MFHSWLILPPPSPESGGYQVLLSSCVPGTQLPKGRYKLFFQLPLRHCGLVAYCLSSTS